MSSYSYVKNEEDDAEEFEEYDHSVYDILEFAQAGSPCLTFDFLRGPFFEQPQTTDPYKIFLLAGSQSDIGKNSLTVIYVSNLRKIKHKVEKEKKEESESTDESSESEEDEEDDVENDKKALFEYASFDHLGVVNRLRTTDLSGGIGGTDIPYAASWSESGNVYLWDLTKPVEAVQDARAMVAFVRNRGKQTCPAFTHDAHSVEGFSLDWSTINRGHLLSGDCSGAIRLLHPGSRGDWQESSVHYDWHKGSVEDIQWSPCEQSVFASASTDRCIAIWDTRVGNRCQLFVNRAHMADVNVINWNRRDSNLLASGGDDGIIKIWDLRLLASSAPVCGAAEPACVQGSGAQCTPAVATFPFHKKPITSIEWHPVDSSVLCASSDDGQVTLWDLAVERIDSVEDDEVPSQLMFNHEGLKDIKEVHWHPGISGLVCSTSLDGFCFFKSISV